MRNVQYDSSKGFLAALLAGAVVIPATSCTSPSQTSSSSHFATCDSFDDCMGVPGAVDCRGGYCVDDDGARIRQRDAGTDGAKGTPDGGGGGGRDPGTGGATSSGGAGAGGQGAGGTAAGGQGAGDAATGGVSGLDGSVGAACRTQQDCAGETLCRAPDHTEPPCRGVPCPEDECFDDDACAPGLVCSFTYDGLCSELQRVCAPPCGPDAGACSVGFACDATGHCYPDGHCALGTPCPAHTNCDPDVGQEATGCARDTCTSDTDCSGGVCVLGSCYEGTGSCQSRPEPCLAP